MRKWSAKETAIYVSNETIQRLWWIFKSEKNRMTDEQGFPITNINAIAERILNERMEEIYPTLKSMEKRFNALEEQMLVELEQNKQQKEK